MISSHVHPGQGGGIPSGDISELDILCGRGTKYCHHRGNKRYHLLVQVHCSAYKQAQSKDDKTKISRSIVDSLRNSSPPTRFIEKKATTKDGADAWYEIGNKRAWEKTSQLLREMVSKGNHKTVYQKRKWDKELKRKSNKKPTRNNFDSISPPRTYREHSPTFCSSVSSAESAVSCFSTAGSTNSSFSTTQGSPSPIFNAYPRPEVSNLSPSRSTCNLTSAFDPLVDPLTNGHSDRTQPYAQNENTNAGSLLAPNEHEKYNECATSRLPYQPANQEVPILGAISSMQASLNYLLGSLNVQAASTSAYMNPYQNNAQLPFSSVQRTDDLTFPAHLSWSHGYAQNYGGPGNGACSEMRRSVNHPTL